MTLIASCTEDAAIATAKTGNISVSSNLSRTYSFVDVSEYFRGHPKKGIFRGVSSLYRIGHTYCRRDGVYLVSSR